MTYRGGLMLYRKRTGCVKLLGLAWLAMTLTACQTTTDSNAKTINTLAFCDVAQPIYWSRKDTLKTIEQVKIHNAIGKACGWK
jgi:hypothetical protein